MTLNELIDMLVDYRSRGQFYRNGLLVVDTNGREEVIIKATIKVEDETTNQAMFLERTEDVFITPVSIINYHGNHIRILGYKCAPNTTYIKDENNNYVLNENGYGKKHLELII